MSEVPKGWKEVLVKDIFHVETGTTPPTGVKEYWEKGTVNWYTPVDLSKITETIYLPESERKITARAVKEVGLRIIPPNSIIVSTRAPVGYVGLTLVESTFNQGCKGLVPKKSDVFTEFFAYYLRWIRPKLEKYSGGSTFQELKKEALESLILLKPPLPEQRKIVEVLSKVDSLIEKTEKIIEKYERIKRGLAQDLLTRGIDENGRIRSEETHEFKDSPIGRIPKEWKVVKLGDISFLKARIGWQGLRADEYLEKGDYYLVTGVNFKNGKIDWDSCVYISKRRYDMDKNIQLKIGDVLVTKDGTIGKVVYVDYLPKPATLGTGVFVLRPVNGSYEPLYMYHVLTSFIFERFMENLKAGSTITHLYQKDFVLFEFPLPPLQEQRRIAQVLSQVDNILEKERRELEKLKRLKRGLMNDLLSGKVRVTPLLEASK